MKKSYLFIIHFLFWLLFVFNVFINSRDGLSAFDGSGLLVNFCTFYFNYLFLIPFVIKKNKAIYYIFGLITGFLFFAFLRYGIEEILFPKVFGFRNYFEGTSIFYYIFDNFYWGSNAIFISSLIWFLDYSFKIEKQNKKLLVEKKIAEVSLLKSQINPHFIFNTLNNIYSLVYQKSEKALPAIEKLGDLLRFSGKEITNDFISLMSEIRYIESLIELESLRFTNPENVQLELNIENENIQIAPMIIIPFVENAFKHGDIQNSPIIISIKNIGTEIHFHQKNKISNAKKDVTSGIGIKNVKQRLEFIYGKNHSLKIDSEKEFYELNLIIKTE